MREMVVYARSDVPCGKQKRLSVNAIEGLDGHSLDDARAAMSKIRVLKKENRLMDIKQESAMTFEELSKWYLGLESVKKLKSYWLAKLRIGNFTAEFGNRVISTLKKAPTLETEFYLMTNLKIS
ncbi:hypothetical protein ACFL2E_12845 [Thermodesulfobacteriota bacterium]